MNKERYLSTGEFAKLVGTTKYTLFHYDDTGLLCPEVRLGNKYRYYSFRQIDIYEVISTLRELGMPLREIKEYLDRRTPDSLLQLFEKEDRIIEEHLEKLREIQEWISVKRQCILEGARAEPDEIKIVYEERKYLIQAETESTKEMEWTIEMGKLWDYCEAHGINSPYGIGFKQNLSDILKETYYNYHIIYELTDKKPKQIEAEEKPEGMYLIAYHKGKWQEMEKTYKRIMKYVRENKLVLGPYFYEDYLLDGLSVKREEEYVTRVSCLILEGQSKEIK